MIWIQFPDSFVIPSTYVSNTFTIFQAPSTYYLMILILSIWLKLRKHNTESKTQQVGRWRKLNSYTSRCCCPVFKPLWHLASWKTNSTTSFIQMMWTTVICICNMLHCEVGIFCNTIFCLGCLKGIRGNTVSRDVQLMASKCSADGGSWGINRSPVQSLRDRYSRHQRCLILQGTREKLQHSSKISFLTERKASSRLCKFGMSSCLQLWRFSSLRHVREGNSFGTYLSDWQTESFSILLRRPMEMLMFRLLSLSSSTRLFLLRSVKIPVDWSNHWAQCTWQILNEDSRVSCNHIEQNQQGCQVIKQKEEHDSNLRSGRYFVFQALLPWINLGAPSTAWKQ